VSPKSVNYRVSLESTVLPPPCALFLLPLSSYIPVHVTKNSARDVPLQILIGWIGKCGTQLNPSPPIRKEIFSWQE
jgi:hypothetical protein